LRLRKLGERELLALVRKHFSVPRKDVVLGIGDDAAIINPGRGKLLVSKDLLVEDSDFIFRLQDPRLLGRKSLNVNLSDIAAMGGRALYAVLGLGLPKDISLDWVIEFFAGFKEAGREGGTILIGGDISQAGKVLVSVTVIGEAGRSVLRSGARPGDRVFVSGVLGDAKQGLILYKRGRRLGEDATSDVFLKAFLDPRPRTALGRKLAAGRVASAMIDCSDGLSVDLNHICEASGVGAEIDLTKIPLSPALRSYQKKPLPLALHGGEDFELIFTVPAGSLARAAALGRTFPLTEIGRITREKGIRTVDEKGKLRGLEIRGFEHFR
jgi:thiamine-monophosphate kinase